jgi:hypothetical protein
MVRIPAGADSAPDRSRRVAGEKGISQQLFTSIRRRNIQRFQKLMRPVLPTGDAGGPVHRPPRLQFGNSPRLTGIEPSNLARQCAGQVNDQLQSRSDSMSDAVKAIFGLDIALNLIVSVYQLRGF